MQFAEGVQDTALTSSRLNVRREKADLDIVISVATRRYREPNRVVLVSRTHVRPKMAATGASVGITYCESRIRILRSGGDPVAAPLVTTTMQSYVAVSRESTIEGPAEGWGDGKDTEFAVEGWRHSIKAQNQAVENLLVDGRWRPRH